MSQKPFNSDGGFSTTGNVTTSNNQSSIDGFGSIVFADGTIQTTAYQTAQQYGYFTEMSYQSNTAYGEAVVVDADGNTYVSYTSYDNNLSQNFGGVAKFDANGNKLWSNNLQSSISGAEQCNIVSLEYADMNGTPSVVATGYYYNNNTSLNQGFVWFINPTDGSVGTMFDTSVVGSNYGITLNDAVSGFDGNSQPYVVMAGNSNNEYLQRTFTPLAPSTTDKLYVSWSEFNASGLANNTEITINSPSYAGAYLNAVNATATPTGSGDGLNLRISAVQGGSYIITRVNGWSGYINGWSVPQSVRILGSVLGGTDGVNDMTFDFDRTIFNDNANNINAAVSNIQGTPISDVYCPGWNSFNWGTLIGTPTAFNVSIGNQAYISRLGNNSWSKSVGGSDYEQINSVAVDADGNTYAVGYYYDGTSRSGIVIKYDIDGVQQWAVYVDPSSQMGITLYSVDVMTDGNIICVGDYGITTKLDSTDGSIIWQVKIDDYMSWDASFRGTATPDGDYIFANYESDNYYLYVMRVSGVDGSAVWTKEIKRFFNGSDGEIYPEDDFDAQYIDCNATQVSIGLTSYFNGANPEYVGLVINFPIDGENCDGTYGEYIINSYSFNWVDTGTSSTAATVTTLSTTETAGPSSPTGSSVDLDISVDPIGGGAVTTPPIKIEHGTSYANIADADGNLVISVSNDNMTWTFDSNRNILGKENNDITVAALDTGDGPQVRQLVTDGNNNLARTGLDQYSYTIQTDIQGSGWQWQFNGPNLSVNQDSNFYGYDHSVGLVSMYTGSGDPKASLRSVSYQNDPNVFTSIDATHSGANIKVYNGGSAGGTEYAWQFDNGGNLTLPGNTFAVNYANGTPVSIGGGGSGNIGNLSATGNVIYSPGTPYPTGFVNFDTGTVMALGTNNTNSVQIVTDEQGLNNIWEFGASGNLTLPTNTANINYANGVSILAGISGGSYGNANVVANLAALGSNPVSTAGNITGGNLIATANVLGNGYARFVGTFDESQASTLGLYLGYAGGTPRIMLATGNTQQTFEIDNDGGTLRFYQPGSTKASLDANGNFSAAGNVTGANVVTGGIVSATGNVSGNYFIGNGSQLTGISTVAEASFSIQTSNFNATAGSRYGVNTTSGAVTATLPTSPSTGAAIFFADAGGAYASNNLTINPNGGTIMGASGNMTVSTNNQSVGLFYNGSTWRTYNAG